MTGLYVWEDANGNGMADPGEVQSLSSLGITSIGLESTPVNETVNGNLIEQVATFAYAGGASAQVAEAYFDNAQIDARYAGSFTLNPQTLLLPDLCGYGTLAPLYAAMSLDPALERMVSGFASGGIADMGNYTGEVNAILYRWAGVDGVDPTSRGQYVNAQRLGFLEAFDGESYVADGGSPNPNGDEGEELTITCNALFTQLEVRLIVQGPLAEVFPDVRFDYATDSLTGSINDSAIAHATPTGTFEAGQYWNRSILLAEVLAADLGDSASAAATSLQNTFNALNLPFTLAQVENGNDVFGFGDGQVSVNEAGATGGVLTLPGLSASDVALQADAAT